ncbi:hypothetical protein [Comamonas sp. Y33R10-2]|uniref:hypothetical protein n=1 Tax=Comamonas sp. Y33R10-2 TaxID=2853257 RepID=UPI002103C635|nr:hypothetical protein [Comamonas sp. Y33R10-2]
MSKQPAKSLWETSLLGLLAAVGGLAFLWPSLPAHPSNAAPGHVLLQAQAAGVLRVAMRRYSRPSLPSDPLPPEPDSYDEALANWLGQLLNVPIEIASAEKADLVLEGIAEQELPSSAASYLPEDLQLLTLKQQTPQWVHIAPAQWPWRSWLKALAPSNQLTNHPQPTVCIGIGQASLSSLQAHGLQPMPAASSVHAISDFLAGKCHLLAESPKVINRLLQQGSWRFYAPLGKSFSLPEPALIRLKQSDAQSAQWLERAVKQWQRSGLQQRAQDSRVSTIALEASLLEDGAICH